MPNGVEESKVFERTDRRSAPLLAMGCDRLYAFPLAVTLSSVLRHSSRRIDVIVLDGGLDNKTRSRIRKVATRGNVLSLRFITTNCNRIDRFSNARTGRDHLTKAAFARLLLPEVLAAESRAIWLDCDVLCSRDICDLWDSKCDTALSAVRDMFLPIWASDHGLSYLGERNTLSYNPKRPYFNSGVMLVNLDLWRKLNIEQQAIEFLSLYGQNLNAADQDILNAVFYESWTKLSYDWNDQGPSGRQALLGNADKLSSTECGWIREFTGENSLRHFTGPSKPWQSGLFDSDCRRWVVEASSSGYLPSVQFALWRLYRLQKVVRVAIGNLLMSRRFEKLAKILYVGTYRSHSSLLR